MTQKASGIDSLVNKGEELNSRNTWIARIGLIAIAAIIILAMVLRKRAANKKKIALVTEKNKLISKLEKEKRQREEKDFQDKVEAIEQAILIDTAKIGDIEEELKNVEEAEKKEQEVLSSINDWGVFSSYFNKSS